MIHIARFMIGLILPITEMCMADSINIFNTDEEKITVINGSDAIMKCNILVNLNLSQYMNISWIKSPRQILTRGFYRVTENRRFDPQSPAILNTQNFNLKISPVLLADEGEYRCNFIYGRQIFAKKVTLIVHVPPKITKHPLAMIKIDEGRSIKLTCAAMGKPPPRISWYLVTYPFGELKLIPLHSAIDKYDTDVIVSDGNLKIDRSNRNLRGTYRCVAENDLGSVYFDIKVQILYPPEIHMANEIITQSINQNTVIVCQLSSYPLGMINWYFGNISLKTNLCGIINDKSTKYCMYEQRPPSETSEVKVISRLNLFGLTKNDFGTYFCKSQTILGPASGSTHLKMNSVPTLDDDIQKYDDNNVLVHPKSFTENPKTSNLILNPRKEFHHANSKKLSKSMEQQQRLNSMKQSYQILFLIGNSLFLFIYIRFSI